MPISLNCESEGPLASPIASRINNFDQSIIMKKITVDGHDVFTSGNIANILPSLQAKGSIGKQINDAIGTAQPGSCPKTSALSNEDQQSLNINIHIYMQPIDSIESYQNPSETSDSLVQRACIYSRHSMGAQYSNLSVLHLTNYSRKSFLSMWTEMEHCYSVKHTKALGICLMDVPFEEFMVLWHLIQIKPSQILISKHYKQLGELRKFSQHTGVPVCCTSKTQDIDCSQLTQSGKIQYLVRYDMFSTDTNVLLNSGYLLEVI